MLTFLQIKSFIATLDINRKKGNVEIMLTIFSQPQAIGQGKGVVC
jgi:hypothetical protein